MRPLDSAELYRTYDRNMEALNNGAQFPDPEVIGESGGIGREGVFWIRTVLLAVVITMALW